MAKKKSSQMAYFLNTSNTATPTWASLGKGITSLPISYNPKVSTETYINEDSATSNLDSYEVSAAIDVSLWDSTSAPAHAFMEELRQKRGTGADAAVQILEIDISTTSPHKAQLSAGIIALDTFTVEGGEAQKLSATIHFNGDPQTGTAVVTAGAPVFTKTP